MSPGSTDLVRRGRWLGREARVRAARARRLDGAALASASSGIGAQVGAGSPAGLGGVLAGVAHLRVRLCVEPVDNFVSPLRSTGDRYCDVARRESEGSSAESGWGNEAWQTRSPLKKVR